MKSNNFGLDKLQLYTKDYSIKDATSSFFGHNVSVPQGGKEIPHLITDLSGNRITANKIYRNTPFAQYSVNHLGLSVQFNPSSRNHPYHLTATGKQFNETIGLIKNDMQQSGISANLESMRMTRIDITEQHEMLQPCFQYNSVFKLLKGKRCKNQREYPTGYQMGNNQWQTVGYDKLQKLIDMKQSLVIEGEKNLLRVENKYLKGDAINTHLKFNTLKILKDITPNDLRKYYTNHLQKNVFNKHLVSNQLFIDFDNEKCIMEQIISNSQSSILAVTTHLMSIGGMDIPEALLNFGGIEKYRLFLEDFYTRTATYKIINSLQKVIATKNLIEVNRSNSQVTVSSLMEEMYSKFAA
jgi:hypothetical protein